MSKEEGGEDSMDRSFHYMMMVNYMQMQKSLLDRVKGYGLTSGQPKVLDYLKDHDGASQKEIAAGCHIEAGSLTSVLNRMEEKDLIRRRTLHGNRRTFHIFLTENGKEKQRIVEQAFQEVEERALAGVGGKEQEELLQILDRVYENMKEGDFHE